MDEKFKERLLQVLADIVTELGLLRKQVAKLNEFPVDVEVDGKPSQE